MNDQLTPEEVALFRRMITGYEFITGMAYFKGDKGDKGFNGDNGKDGQDGKSIKGDKGECGEKGNDGKDGRDGKDGKNGKDAEVDYTKIFKEIDKKISLLPPAKDGRDGKDGKDGKDGVSVGYVTEIIYRFIRESDIEILKKELLQFYPQDRIDKIVQELKPVPLDEITHQVIEKIAQSHVIL